MKQQAQKIVKFIQKTLKQTAFKKAVVAVSGGVDSAVALNLLCRAVGSENVLAVKLPYGKQNMNLADKVIQQAKIPTKNIIEINIEPAVNKTAQLLDGSTTDRVRLGNIMARVRMILIYDLAKKQQALVCGTENRSEYLLGYFTRFGDEASDLEPLRHLYKTQVYQLAEYLKIPQPVIKQPPSAGLWSGQTDEKEMGFSYTEADTILRLYFDKKICLAKIKNQGYKKTGKIINRVKKNRFKHQTPYCLGLKIP